MPRQKQISARVSESTATALDEFLSATGIKQGHFVEAAIAFHLRATATLPPAVVVPTSIKLTDESARKVANLVDSPPAPTPTMMALYDDSKA